MTVHSRGPTGAPVETPADTQAAIVPATTAAPPSQRTSSGRFASGHTLSARKRPYRTNLLHYVQHIVGGNGKKIIDKVWDLAQHSKSESIRLKAAEILLDRGFSKVGTGAPNVTTQPMFALPPGAHVAIAMTIPPLPTPTAVSDEIETIDPHPSDAPVTPVSVIPTQ